MCGPRLTSSGETGTKAIEDFLKTHLGEKGFSGLDLGKPVLGYVILTRRTPRSPPSCSSRASPKEEEFLDFLTRCHLEPTPDKDKKGLFKLGTFDLPMNDKPVTYEVLMRIVESTAYIGFNVKADGLDPAKLYKADKLFDPKETALFAMKQFNDRISPEVLKGNLKSVEMSIAKMKETLGAGDESKVIFDALEKLMASMVKVSLDSKETGSRVTLDTATGELAFDAWYTPKAGTDFAKSLAARKPSMNQFAGLADNTTVGGMMLQAPVGIKEMQDLMLAGLDAWDKQIMSHDPPPEDAKELYNASLNGLRKTIKSGEMDFAITMNGPDKDGHFVAAAGLTFADALPVEKSPRGHQGLPRGCPRYDQARRGQDRRDQHPRHRPASGRAGRLRAALRRPQDLLRLRAEGHLRRRGQRRKDALKTAINGKPGPANPFDILANPKRLGQAVAAAEPNIGPMAEKIFGNEDKVYSAYTFSISGGDALRLKFGVNLKILPKFIYQWTTGG